MKFSGWLRILVVMVLCLGRGAFGQTAPALKVVVLAQGPAEAKTELQIFCLFRSSAENALHGSLVEIDEKLHGLLGQIRKPELFGGELGETIVLTPPQGTLGATRVLIIGLGDSANLTPARMYLVGKIAMREANRLGVAHPFFAPTVLDGGVSNFSTGDVAEQVTRGIRDGMASEAVVRKAGAGGALAVVDFTFLAGAAHVADTQGGINRALGK
jgi:Cytosol aminopeptidase family, N-terminal domain